MSGRVSLRVDHDLAICLRSCDIDFKMIVDYPNAHRHTPIVFLRISTLYLKRRKKR